jgi:hypothetical protein
MKRSIRCIALVVVVGGSLLFTARPALAQTPNIVIQWNRILQTLFTPAPGPQLRALPMLHIAMFDAVNSIEDVYTPYRMQVKGSRGASAEAAAATSRHEVVFTAEFTSSSTPMRARRPV